MLRLVTTYRSYQEWFVVRSTDLIRCASCVMAGWILLRKISTVFIAEKGFLEIGVCQRNSAIQACVCVYQSIQRINLAPVWCIDQLPVGHREAYWSETLPNPGGSIYPHSVALLHC